MQENTTQNPQLLAISLSYCCNIFTKYEVYW